MSDREHIDDHLEDWEFDPQSLSVRMSQGRDGRQIIQMRVDMGILQLEVDGRPDGDSPEGYASYFDYLNNQVLYNGDDFVMNEEQCNEVDREFVQFYHRRICWLKLQEYDLAVLDADHTLGLMDFCQRHSPDEQWTVSHEQYRPFVMFHRTQAAALAALEQGESTAESATVVCAESAMHEINQGLERMRSLFEEHNAEDDFDDDELVSRLTELRESLREEYKVGRTIYERLADAVASEQYELAAKIRDELNRRGEADPTI